MSTKPWIVGGLLIAALAWVVLLSLASGVSGRATETPASDGSRATIKRIDKSRFYEFQTGEIGLLMDIRDPGGQPILGLSRDDLQVAEEGVPVDVKEFKGPGTQSLNVIFVIDISGSMSASGRMGGARDAALAALDELKVGRDRIGIITFDHEFDVVQPLADLTVEVQESCRREIAALRPRGGTVISRPTLEALRIFEQSLPKGSRIAMVMTDGIDEELLNPESRRKLVRQLAELSDRLSVPVYTISFGNRHEVDDTSLRDLAESCQGAYYHAPGGEELAAIYRSRVQELSEEFLVVYDSPYPTADGLPRTVEIQVASPSGTLAAKDSYEIGPLISGARRSTSAVQSDSAAASSPASSVLKVLLFVVLFALLVGGLVVPPRGLSSGLALGGAANDPSAAAAPSSTSASSSPALQPKPTAAPPSPPPPPPPPVPGKPSSGPAPKGAEPGRLGLGGRQPAASNVRSGGGPPPPPPPVKR